jgi:hypothetical protein
VLRQDDARKASAQTPSGQLHYPPRCTYCIPKLFFSKSLQKNVCPADHLAYTLAGLCSSTQLAFAFAITVLFALTDVARSYLTDTPDPRTGLGLCADGDQLAASTRLPAHRQAHRAHTGQSLLARPPERAEAHYAQRFGRRTVHGGDCGSAEGGRRCVWRARRLGTRRWFLVVLGSGTLFLSDSET